MSQKLEIKLSGGLGNQLFQVCAGLYLQDQLNATIIYNVSNLMVKAKDKKGNYTRHLQVTELIKNNQIVYSKLPIRIQIVVNLIQKKLFSNKFLYENPSFDNLLEKVTPNTRQLNGFFQNSKLVEDIWPSFAKKLEASNKFAKFINVEKINRVAIHLRFGDYSDDPKTKSTHGLTNSDFYLNAYKDLISANSNESLNVIVVTDDLIRARDVINSEKINSRVEYSSNSSALEDLLEIARSTHVIMSNSTFSWWGAWFAFKSHDAKVIYPRPWFAEDSDPDLPIYVDKWKSLKRSFTT